MVEVTDRKRLKKKTHDIFNADLNKKGRPKRHILRKIITLLIIIALLLAANGYYTYTRMKEGGIEVDGSVNENDKILSIFFTITNDGYLSLDINVSLDLHDMSNDLDLGNHTLDIDLERGETVRDTIKIPLENASIVSALSTEGLTVRYIPTFEGAYAGYIPLPETELSADSIVVKG